MSEQKNRRRALALQGGVAAAVATAVLLGGFGAFSLWNDSISSGAGGNIATGTLKLDSVTDGEWTITKTDGVLLANSPIDISTFKASPGDVLEYTADVQLTADASDMLADLVIDPNTYKIDPSLADGVTVQLTTADGTQAGTIPITAQPGPQDIPVTVTVTFSDDITGLTGQSLDSAVTLDGLNFALDQRAG